MKKDIYKDSEEVYKNIFPLPKNKKLSIPDKMLKVERTLKRGRYQIVYKKEDNKSFNLKPVKNKKVFVNVDGEQKPLVINGVSQNIKDGTVTFDVTVLQNPIPLIIVGYALLGTVFATTTGFMLHEVNETSKTLLPLLLVGGGIYIFMVIKKR